MKLHVQCYAGRKVDERPLRFQLKDHEYLVEEVLDQWYGPEHSFFKLRADDGNLYILRHQTSVPNVRARLLDHLSSELLRRWRRGLCARSVRFRRDLVQQ